jgi:hypothetical protein
VLGITVPPGWRRHPQHVLFAVFLRIQEEGLHRVLPVLLVSGVFLGALCAKPVQRARIVV